MDEKISIIVPIYNAEEWLEKCVNSIVEQTYFNIEILLINDGSTDKSLEICKKFENKDNRIKVIDKKNEGVSKTRNLGIEKATGQYIKFVDSDDWLEKNTCEELIKIVKEEKTDLVICGLNIYKNNELLRTPHLEKRIIEIKKNIKEFEYIYKVFASPCNKLYRKDKIAENFRLNLDIGEDLLFNIKYLENIEKISVTDKCLYNVCLDNEDSLNRKFRKDKLDVNLDLTSMELEFCKKNYQCNIKEMSFLYNKYILLLHAYLLQMIYIVDKKSMKKMIKKYINDKRIKEACNVIKFDRIDYNFFRILIKRKQVLLIYYFIKLKTIILGEIQNDKK